MIRNYFWVIHIIIKKIVIESTQSTHGVLRTSPGGLLKVLTSETCREVSEDCQGTNPKIDDFIKK